MNKLFIDNESCDIDGDAFTVHGNSVKVKGRHTGSINV